MLADIIFSQQSTVEPNGNRIITNPNVLFRLPSFPAVYSFAISVIINDIEASKLNHAKLYFLAENGETKEIFNQDIPHEVKQDENLAIGINVQNFDISAEGKMTAIFEADDKLLAKKEIYFSKEK